MLSLRSLFLILLTAALVGCGEPGGDGSSGSLTSENQPDDEELFAVIDLPTALSLRWTAPTRYTDNSVLQAGDLTNYRVYYGTERGNYTEIEEFDALVYPNAFPLSELELIDLKTGRDLITVYIAMTAVDKDGIESQISEVVAIGI